MSIADSPLWQEIEKDLKTGDFKKAEAQFLKLLENVRGKDTARKLAYGKWADLLSETRVFIHHKSA